ncbi:G3E family GTPase [Spirosoma oryzae]|uniref:G3E family GTPase n=1 Tax=Spirosoma oryzae TaxID=1469603 RepID=A0A2T0SUJ5_9BACT|nr:GTP-binding protein [Spirosoma oryzae]PRY37082.1 G3E family GTPase [Spirosoma oryzae]
MPKDVTILTGFLGAGKTTLLNALMNTRPHTRFALIENEFGKEGIDGDMVIRPDVDIVELSNGCLCCSLNDDLLTVLEELNDRSDRFDELIIETTGIADPANVALPFLMLPAVQRDFSLKRVVCLVDAELVEDQLRDTEEAIAQISFSDLIVINKTDRVSTVYLAKLVEMLQGMNPMAQILTGHKEDYPIEAIMAFTRTAIAPDKPGRFTPSRPVAKVPVVKPRSSASGSNHHHHKHSDIVSLSFRFTESMDLTSLYHRLMTLLLFQGQDIYRVKGIIYDQTRKERWIIQSVGKNITLLEGTPWQEDEEQLSRVVIIGKLLKPEDFEKMLRQCLSKESSWQITNSTTLLKTPTL